MTRITYLIGAMLCVILIDGSMASAAVDLVPYEPDTWDDVVVVADEPDSFSDGTIYANVTCFIAFAVGNGGNSRSGAFNVSIWDQTENRQVLLKRMDYVDGLRVDGHYNFTYTFTTTGWHTLRMKVDANGEVSESNESNNEYTRQVYVNRSYPDLVPAKVDPMSDKLVVADRAYNALSGDTYGDGTIYTNRQAYIACGTTNIGQVGTGGSYWIRVWDDTTKELVFEAQCGPLDLDVARINFGSWTFTVSGWHTLRYTVDSKNNLTESNENNNQYTRQINISPARAELVPNKPDGWDDKLVVYRSPATSGSSIKNANVTTYSDAYIAYSVGNSGGARAGTFTVEITDTTENRRQQITHEFLDANKSEARWNLPWIFRQGGTHTLRIKVDAGAAVTEYDEGNNEYTRQVNVQGDVVSKKAEIPGASDVPSSVPCYRNNQAVYPVEGLPDANGICIATAAADVLGYWDRTPYDGVTYWNLVDNGTAPLSDLNPPTAPGHDRGNVVPVVQTIGRYYYDPNFLPERKQWKSASKIARDAIGYFTNDSDCKNNLAFVVTLRDSTDPCDLYGVVCREIDAKRPALWSVSSVFGGSKGHAMPVIGYVELTRQSQPWRLAFVHVNTGDTDSAYVSWSGGDRYDVETDSVITIVPGGVPSDHYEPDNSSASANLIDPTHVYEFRQTHNFAVAGDVDWVKFQAVAGRSYTIEATNLGAACRTQMSLYKPDGTTLITTGSDTSPKPGSKIAWSCSQSGTYYLSVRHKDAAASGHNTNYDVQITQTP